MPVCVCVCVPCVETPRGRRLRALKSCLDCGTSFCALHLELHQRAPKLQRHTLTEPLENPEERLCQKHRRPLELFCRDDHTCVCEFCTEGEHKNHNTVPLEEEGKDRKVRDALSYFLYDCILVTRFRITNK